MSDRVNSLLAAFDDSLPLDRARTLPSAFYIDSEVAAAERRAVFGGWQAIGRVDQVAEPGHFLTADVAGEPIAVVRGDDGVLRAFANVCRHRAARVLCAAEGRAPHLRCRYHGWTYDLTGALRGTPHFADVADFRKEDHGLPTYAVDVWGPLVFVHLGAAEETLAEALAPLPTRVAGLGLGRLRFRARREYRLACNWKVFVDNYLDGGYHIATVHPGLASVLDDAQYRIEVFERTSLQSSPLTASGDAALDAVRKGDRAHYWWVFPNLMLNIYDGVMDTNLVLPLGPEACRVVFDFYFAEGIGEDFVAKSVAVADAVQQEDGDVCEEVQRGLASARYDVGRFSVTREAAGYHFHQLVAERLACSP